MGYWVERKARWRKGQDNTYHTDLRNQVCNTQLRALCCPKPVQGVTRRPILTESPGNTALIITGGWNGDGLSSVEVYHPGTNTSCTLPSLPEKITYHSQNGLVQCGGYHDYSVSSCYTLDTNTGQWTKTHSLSERRDGHSSWRREDGTILLMGGDYSYYNTTELVSESSGVSTPGFTLKYATNSACSITDTSSIVVTGGAGGEYFGVTSRVTRYDETGWVEDLPSLLTARRSHGCALYTTDTGDKVYVVMGGFATVSSTETLQLGDSYWRESTALPRPLSGLRAATLNNIIYIAGGADDDYEFRDEIYQLDSKTRSWVEVTRMKTPRDGHGLSVIKYSEVEGLCTEE